MEGKFANNSSLVLKKRKPTVEKVPQTAYFLNNSSV